MTQAISQHQVQVDGLNIHYREIQPSVATAAAPILLLHGFPTSSYLWRNIMPSLADGRRVIAIDLPGYGLSDKPLDASYSFRFYSRVLDGFLAELGIDRIGLVVHDVGGPIGLYWACHHPERVERLALLNTLVYSKLSWAAMVFVFACKLPGLRSLLTSPYGLKRSMHLGITNRNRISQEMIRNVQLPFQEKAARKALLKAGAGLHPDGLKDIERLLPGLTMPVRLIYGADDPILPDVAKTMARVAEELPQAKLTELPNCSHFLQEDCPEQVAELLADFFLNQQPEAIQATDVKRVQGL